MKEYKKLLIKENRRSNKHERDVLAKEMSKTPKQIKCLLQNLREIKKCNEKSHSLKDEDVKGVNKSCNPKEENLVKNDLHRTIMPEILTNFMNKLKSGEKVKLKTSEIHPGEPS